jgi:hypothetical protein
VEAASQFMADEITSNLETLDSNCALKAIFPDASYVADYKDNTE